MRLSRIVAEIDMIASLIKRLVPSLANFLKRSVGEPKKRNAQKFLCSQSVEIFVNKMFQNNFER